MRLAILALAIALGCGGEVTQISIKPPPPKMTTGTLAGALCSGNQCKCRDGAGDGGAGLPTDGRKRYEIRLGSAYDLWLTMPGAGLYKSPKKAEYAGVKKGTHDPCGSTRVKGVMWDHGKAPDHEYPSELAVNLTIEVYKFAPWQAHGEACHGRGPKGEALPEGPAEEPATP